MTIIGADVNATLIEPGMIEEAGIGSHILKEGQQVQEGEGAEDNRCILREPPIDTSSILMNTYFHYVQKVPDKLSSHAKYANEQEQHHQTQKKDVSSSITS